MCEVTLSVYLTYQVLHIVSHYSSYYYILLYLALLQSFWICLRYSVCSLPDFLPIAVDGFSFTFWNCAPVLLNKKANLQLHPSSSRSHDSGTKIPKYTLVIITLPHHQMFN